MQGVRPEGFVVVLGTGERVRFRTNQFLHYYRQLKQSFLKFQNRFNAQSFPDPGASRNYGRWNTFAEQVLDAADHLTRVANITRSQITKLEAAGLQTLTELATSPLEEVPEIPRPTFIRLRKQAQLQVDSHRLLRPLYEVQLSPDNQPQHGLALLPPASPLDIFFDIEGYPHREGGLEYLLGATHLEQDELKFADWWAHDDPQEKKAFERFIDWTHDRWKTDSGMHIYHYAPYEVTAMRRLMGKYATREREVDDLLRNQVFIDLYKIVRQGLIVGTPSYSLKDIEHLYMDNREGEVTTAGGSVVAYHQWLESGQSQDWRESEILEEIRDYNKVDCDSTWLLANWLREIQRKAGIAYAGSDGLGISEKNNDSDLTHPTQQLAEHLLDEVESGKVTDEEKSRVQQLLTWLLEFHWREDKPVFWRMFDWHEKSESELIDEFDCLGGLQRTSKPETPIKRSHLFEYQYAPDQNTKLHVGSKCFFSHDLTIRTVIEHLDSEKGLVEIKLGPSVTEVPETLCLIPDEHVSSTTLAKAVFRYVEAWSKGTVLSRAVDDLLHRRPPRIKGHLSGPILTEETDLVPAVIATISRLDQSVLCIQGPPGTGKTYTAAQAILQLLKENKKVAVTANSHKAILNVLRAVHEAVTAAGEDFPLFKVRGEGDDWLINSGRITPISSSGEAAAVVKDGAMVMGGTAWVFSRPELEGVFDFLFIDEAGQFSLANVVATGLAAKNMVLIGDQMQLAQPIQGTHPGDSGKSALEYLLGEHATIPSDLGIFLSQIWRMHPHICDFISEAVYEHRLHPHPDTAKQRIVFPEGYRGLITKESGILYIPVEHAGNTQSSFEEADVISRIISELLGLPVVPFGGGKSIALNWQDILVVAPFNMQVRRLQHQFGVPDRVGSVDKFQGQEAQVVIISMCSSTLEDSPRGAEFLLEPNRLNVAVSRARTLTIIVGSSKLAKSPCHSIKEMELLNLYCWLLSHAE
ncbi:TM0106 family RecB-like putative nuclease [Polystyrenella longa]|uniref:TM0106 family RecB-like putative nuclease n=1 Tax=Polystyrenella longa TaxID=2528007 RepID=UPI001E5E6CF8|nr:TM0106 family RecB-like putative nuclease [Polystyrenella longa]